MSPNKLEPTREEPVKGLHSEGRLQHCLKLWNAVEGTDSEKHTNLLKYGMYYSSRKPNDSSKMPTKNKIWKVLKTAKCIEKNSSVRTAGRYNNRLVILSSKVQIQPSMAWS